MSIKHFIIICIGAFTMFSCEKDEVLGPDLEGIGNEPVPVGEFELSKESVDFKKGETIFFSQEFEKSTSWKLTLTGLSTGAVKTFENISVSLNSDNTLWDGVSDEKPAFKNEDVIATITFPKFPSTKAIVDTFSISDIEQEKIVTVLFSDFTTAPLYGFAGGPPAGGGWGHEWPLVTLGNTTYEKYDDGAYLYLEGVDKQFGKDAGNPFINIVTIPSIHAATKTDSLLPLYPDPTRVFVNLAVYGTNTDVEFNVEFVDESANGVTATWGIKPNWLGWKYISIRYDKLVKTGAAPFDPSKISLTQFIFLYDGDANAIPAGTEKPKVAIDNLEFSFDAPLGSVNY